MCMQASTSSIDDQLISDAVDLAEMILETYPSDVPDSMLDQEERNWRYKSQLILSLWRSKCQEMQSNAIA